MSNIEMPPQDYSEPVGNRLEVLPSLIEQTRSSIGLEGVQIIPATIEVDLNNNQNKQDNKE